MPAWVDEAYQEYAKRLRGGVELRLKEIPAGKRSGNADVGRIRREEGERMLQAIPRDCRVVALEVEGRNWSTEQLAGRMEKWMGAGGDVALLVGGPEGLSPACRERADELWSLSALTFPHPLVRVILSEQLYRAWSVINNHPYHRA